MGNTFTSQVARYKVSCVALLMVLMAKPPPHPSRHGDDTGPDYPSSGHASVTRKGCRAGYDRAPDGLTEKTTIVTEGDRSLMFLAFPKDYDDGTCHS